jgi:hypothetical protein
MVDSYKIITKVGEKRNCWDSSVAEQLKEKEQNYGNKLKEQMERDILNLLNLVQ